MKALLSGPSKPKQRPPATATDFPDDIADFVLAARPIFRLRTARERVRRGCGGSIVKMRTTLHGGEDCIESSPLLSYTDQYATLRKR